MSSAMRQTRKGPDFANQIAAKLGMQDVGRARSALMQVAAQEAEQNHAFAERVLAAYSTLPPTRKRPNMVTAFDVKLIPIKVVEGREINPAAPLDPYFLQEVYGSTQLPTALSIFPVSKLKEAAAMVERRNPGTKPTHRGQRGPLTQYIVRHLAG